MQINYIYVYKIYKICLKLNYLEMKIIGYSLN